MILEESVELAVAPGHVVAFLEAMDANYLAWHPGHVAFRWTDDARTGFWFHEVIEGVRLRFAMTLTRSNGGRNALCRPTGAVIRMAMPWMSFEVTETAGGCRFTHRIRLRLGPLRPLLRRVLIDPVLRHMAEEAVNLRRLVEAQAPGEPDK